MQLSAVEICAGAGGQALGLECAGFEHHAAVEIDHHACETLRLNRPSWNVIEGDVCELDGTKFRGIDLLAGGVPCPPFSIAGKRLGREDERDLFPEVIRLAREAKPRAVLIENVRGLMTQKFESYRAEISAALGRMGYRSMWLLLNASRFGVPQQRERTFLVAMRPSDMRRFEPPRPVTLNPPTVGEAIMDLMAAAGWENASEWARVAMQPAPTLVGGSKKHGGPDLGPTRARAIWAGLGVDGLGVANSPPQMGFIGKPRLTLRMVARLQGFPDSWQFYGSKTHAYRQVGNALPPPLAQAISSQISLALSAHDKKSEEAKVA